MAFCDGWDGAGLHCGVREYVCVGVRACACACGVLVCRSYLGILRWEVSRIWLSWPVMGGESYMALMGFCDGRSVVYGSHGILRWEVSRIWFSWPVMGGESYMALMACDGR